MYLQPVGQFVYGTGLACFLLFFFGFLSLIARSYDSFEYGLKEVRVIIAPRNVVRFMTALLESTGRHISMGWHNRDQRICDKDFVHRTLQSVHRQHLQSKLYFVAHNSLQQASLLLFELLAEGLKANYCIISGAWINSHSLTGAFYYRINERVKSKIYSRVAPGFWVFTDY